MSETNGGTGGGAGDYRPRHAVPEIYQEMLDTFGDPNRTDDKLYIPKHYASEDDPYSTAYYIPITDMSDPDIDAGPVPPWLPPEEPEKPEEPEEPEIEVVEEEEESFPEPPIVSLPQRILLPEPEPPPAMPGLPSFVPRSRVPDRGRLRHIIDPDDPELNTILGPPPGAPLPEESFGMSPPQPERWRFLKRLRNAFYAGVAAVTAFLTNPEKERRRRMVARTAVVAAGVIAVGLAVWLGPDLHNHHQQPPTVTQPAGPPPNTEQFFDTIQPGSSYHGETYEWSTAASNVGTAEATPKLLRLISTARDNGLSVDTWGSPGHGHWGINSVTVELPDGTHKSYYDTPRKLAILQWYAGGMGPHHG